MYDLDPDGDFGFNKYQQKAHETAEYPNIYVGGHPSNYIYAAMGLAGESGELIEKLKKVVRNKNGLVAESDLFDIKKEVGDVLWYLSELCTCLNLSLKQIARENIKKLSDRKNRGVIKSEGDNR